MEEENKQEYLTIKFDLKPPENINQSIINTIVLLLDNIRNMQDYREWDNVDTVVLNNQIEKIKSELDSLKIIEIKEEQ